MRVRACLWYVAAYLLATGLALALMPQFTLTLMHSNADYGTVMPRWVGMFSLALGTFVVQVIRHRVLVLYPLGFFMPAAMLLGFAGLYLESRNPLFLAVLTVIGIGVVATGATLFVARQQGARNM